jgi:sec-independent protein translocase protein TatA
MEPITHNVLGMWTPGPLEIIVILIIAILIFGRRLPDIARSMGRSLNEFKKGIREAKDTKEDIENDVKDAISLDSSSVKDNKIPTTSQN